MRITTGGDLASAVRLRFPVRRYAMQVLESLGHAPTTDRSPYRLPVRTVAVGLDPVRVLVFGAGLAMGYGVRSRDEAFDRPLAEALAARTGRGVSVENRAVQHLRLPDAVASLGGAGTHTFHVAVWCPSFSDGLDCLRLSAWRGRLHAMVRELREVGRVPLVITHMPVPVGMHPAALLARPWVVRLNQVFDGVAAEYDDVVTCPTEPFTPREVGQPVTDTAYFAAVAAHIEPAVARLLGLPAAARRTAAAPAP